MSRRLLHIVVILLALVPGGLGVSLITRGPTADTPRGTLAAMAMPLLLVAAALLLFAAWSLLRDRVGR